MNQALLIQAKPPSSGFTLIELLIALVLGLLVVAGASALYLGGSRSYREGEQLAQLNDSTRTALSELSHEIEMAGHWAEAFFPPSLISADLDPTAGIDCGPTGTQWKYATSPAIEIVDNVTGATANAAFSCIDASEVLAGTDIISIKRLEGTPTPHAATQRVLLEDHAYARVGNTISALFAHPADASDPILNAIPPPTQDWAYRVTIYYIRNYFSTVGDGIPALCRKLLIEEDMVTEPGSCISGVENLQLEAGIDTDGDGIANYYQANPAVADYPQIVGVRALMLIRSEKQLGGYTNAKTYSVSNAGDITPADQFPRELRTATVLLRNVAAFNLYEP